MHHQIFISYCNWVLWVFAESRVGLGILRREKVGVMEGGGNYTGNGSYTKFDLHTLHLCLELVPMGSLSKPVSEDGMYSLLLTFSFLFIPLHFTVTNTMSQCHIHSHFVNSYTWMLKGDADNVFSLTTPIPFSHLISTVT